MLDLSMLGGLPQFSVDPTQGNLSSVPWSQRKGGFMDKFNTMLNPYGGLLGDEGDLVRQQGLLGLASGLLAASGPSTQRISLGQALGRGLKGMQEGQQGALQNTLMARQMSAQGAPTVKEFNEGNEVVTRQLGPNGQWSEVARAPRWNPNPAPAAQVNINQEKEEAKEVGKGFGQQYNKLQESALASQAKINKVDRMNQLLDGVNTGKLTPVGAELASYAQSLGLNVDPKLGNLQAAESIAREFALELRNPAGGAGMPGAMSDKDREFLQSMVPGIEKTPEGRRLISEGIKKLAQRDIEVARLAREYRVKKGRMDEGFYDELARFANSNPLFGTAEQPGNRPPLSSFQRQ